MSEGFGVWVMALKVAPYSEIAVRAYTKSEAFQLAFEACGLDRHPCGRGDGVCPWWPGAVSSETVRVIPPPMWPRPGVVIMAWHPRGLPIATIGAVSAREIASGVYAPDEPSTYTLPSKEEG